MIYVLYKIEPKGFDLLDEAIAFTSEIAAVCFACKEIGTKLVLTNDKLLVDVETGRVYYQIAKRDL